MEEFPAPPQSFFRTTYDGVPPWEIGRPQATFLALVDSGAIRGHVLDAGCGTGAFAVELAARGLDVTAIDFAEQAIDRARARATERGVRVEFLVVSALALESLGRTFDTVVDVGLFHCFDDSDRAKYVAGLSASTRPGGRLFLQCFSDRERGKIGPRRLPESELRAAFADNWRVDSLEPVRYETLAHDDGAAAWLLSATKL